MADGAGLGKVPTELTEGGCNCTMSVRKLDSGLWVADVTMGRRLDGSRDRRTRQCRTKAEAEQD